MHYLDDSSQWISAWALWMPDNPDDNAGNPYLEGHYIDDPTPEQQTEAERRWDCYTPEHLLQSEYRLNLSDNDDD